MRVETGYDIEVNARANVYRTVAVAQCLSLSLAPEILQYRFRLETQGRDQSITSDCGIRRTVAFTQSDRLRRLAKQPVNLGSHAGRNTSSWRLIVVPYEQSTTVRQYPGCHAEKRRRPAAALNTSEKDHTTVH
jgi:hypothetical protein